MDLADGTVFGDAQFQAIHGDPPVARRRSFEEATLLLHEADRERVLAAYTLEHCLDRLGAVYERTYHNENMGEDELWRHPSAATLGFARRAQA